MTIHAIPIETRSEGDDPITAMTGAVDELRTGFEAFRTSTDQRLTTELRGLADRLGAIETRMNRPNPGNPGNPDAEIERRAFLNFCRTGVERMNADEVRALNVSTDTQGGYLVPQQFLTELQRELTLFSPIRSVARITNAGAPEILLPKRTGRMSASWIGENAATPGTEPAYGQQKFEIHELACHVDVSNRLLEDSAFNLESELAYDFAEEFGKAEGAAFVVGDGVSKPSGLIGNADVPVVTPDAADLIADDLIDLFHALPAAYASRATWAMNRTTTGIIRKLENSSGDYLWQQPLTDGNPPTILGRPVIEFPDLPNAEAGAIPIVLGDFRAGFRVFDRVSLSILRDPYSVQVNGLVRFHARRRVGGGVNKPEAFKFLEMKP